MSRDAEKLIRKIPLFAGLDRRELDDLLRIFQRVDFKLGACLTRQGQPADSAFIVESGAADVITALPGGGEVTVATLGPGSVLGEMALLESGTRSATVIAREAVAGYFVERDGFRMLLAQLNHAAFTIQGRITLTLCKRLRELNAKVMAYNAPEDAAPPAAVSPGAANGVRRGQCSFDYRAFLPVLPVFRGLSAAELDAFAEKAEVMEIPRGLTLFEQGKASTACYVVVRGAVEVSSAVNGRRHRLGILGPGKLCGHLALIEEVTHSTTALARENATLLELSKEAFGRLYHGRNRLAAKFQDAISENLLQALARTNNHLTRLISQARIRGNHVDELHRALGAQDCRTA